MILASLTSLILDEGKWLITAMLVAVVLAYGLTRPLKTLPLRVRILGAMNVYYGCLIGIMGTGHLLAVSVKVGQSTLQGSPWALYPMGLVLAVPAWWLVWSACQTSTTRPGWNRAGVLNGGLAVCLLGLGVHNFPLAAPALLNLAYQRHTRRTTGWAIVVVTVAGNLALLAAAIVFAASGQSFEQFRMGARYNG